MKLIVGLGNYEPKYDNTYHNLGFMTLDIICNDLDVSLNKKGNKAIYGEKIINGEKIFFIKPTTYMNLSGECVLAFVNKYKLSPEDVIVICDDIDITKGDYRYRESGSGGTHNGLRNIVKMLNSTNFKRYRIGISKEEPLIEYVLKKIDKDSFSLIKIAMNNVCKRIEDSLLNG